MGELADFKDRIKRYYAFTHNEMKGMAIAILVIAFIISFKEWGAGNVFDPATGLFNFFNAVLIVALSFLLHDTGQRLWALAIGYRIEYLLASSPRRDVGLGLIGMGGSRGILSCSHHCQGG